MHRVRLALSNCDTWQTWTGHAGDATNALTHIHIGLTSRAFAYPFALVLAAKEFVSLYAITEFSAVPQIDYVLMFQDETDVGVDSEEGRLAMDAKVWAIFEEMQLQAVYANILEYRPATMPSVLKDVQAGSEGHAVIIGALGLTVGFRRGGGR